MSRISSKWFVGVLLLVFIFCILKFLSPPFYTFDSYDYLHLSLFPKYGASHSLAFGHILYVLSRLADFFGKQTYIDLVLLWNAMGIALFLSLGIGAVFNFFRMKKTLVLTILTSGLFLLLFWFIFSALIYVSNAFWSEATNMLHISLFCIVAALLPKMKLWQGGVLAFLLSAWSYHTRYSEIVLPMCFLSISAVFVLRSYFGNGPEILKKQAKSFGVLFLCSILGVICVSQILKSIYPNEAGKNYVTNLAISASMQCALRCDVALFTTTCDNPEGKKTVEESKCSELIFGLRPFGPSVLDMAASPTQIFKRVGFGTTLKWILLAPFTYLSDLHSLEMGLFQFGDDQLGVKHYPEATQYYSQYLVGEKKLEVSPAFITLVQKLERYFTKNRIYHMLTGISVLLALYLIYSSTNVVVLMLSFYSFGTYMLFSYLNPHVPFRYLVLIIAPAFLALLIQKFDSNKSVIKTSLKS